MAAALVCIGRLSTGGNPAPVPVLCLLLLTALNAKLCHDWRSLVTLIISSGVVWPQGFDQAVVCMVIMLPSLMVSWMFFAAGAADCGFLNPRC